MKKTNKESLHLDWDYDKLMKYLIVFLIVTIMLGWVSHSVRENRMVYTKCADSCSKKHFLGIQIGGDQSIPIMISAYKKSTTYAMPYVVEFDRTNCINSCNRMYLALRK